MQLADRIGRRLKLRDLHILATVAERGSMARAARELAISQPVVSKTIADLEHTLGVRLLDRSRQGILPTPYGNALLSRGLAAFDELRQGIKEIEVLGDPSAGEVRVECHQALAAGLLPAVIDRLYRRYPRLIVNVTVTSTNAPLYEDLRQRKVDLVIGLILDEARERHLQVEVLFDETLFVAVGVQNRLAARRKVALGELINEPWVLTPPDSVVRRQHARAFHACGLEVPQARLVTGSMALIHAALATGQFVALLPRSIIWLSPQRSATKVLPIKLPAQPRPAGVVTLKNRTLGPTARLFIDFVREVAKPLATS